MEQIKVRVWDKEQQKFLEIGDSPGQAYPHYSDHLYFVLVGKVDDDGYDYEIDADILLCSSRTDKNGKEIYAGDIVKYSFKDGSQINTRYMEIIYQSAGFKMKEIYRDYWLEKTNGVLSLKQGKLLDHKGETTDLSQSNDLYWTEVVGNIYENPELVMH